MRLVDRVNKPSTVVDFTVPVDGMESPWRLAQFAFIYDSARVSDPPRSIAELGTWAQKHPGRFTHPDPHDFLAATFLKQALVALTPDAFGGARGRQSAPIRFGGVEIIRAVSFIVRDRDWGTFNPTITDRAVEEESTASPSPIGPLRATEPAPFTTRRRSGARQRAASTSRRREPPTPTSRRTAPASWCSTPSSTWQVGPWRSSTSTAGPLQKPFRASSIPSSP